MTGETIQPTISREDAAASPWDVIVVGAGPAGAIAARGLAMDGARTLLVDQAPFPRWKVCGCCLSARAERTLRDAGLGATLDALGARRIERVTLVARGRRVEAALAPTRILSRESLDAALVRAAIHAGAGFMPERRARVLSDRRVRLLDPDAEPTDLDTRAVILATGLRDAGASDANDPRLAAPQAPGSHVGLGATGDPAGAPGLPDHLTMAIGRRGYVGFVRLPDGRLNAAAAIAPALLSAGGGGARGAIARILEEAGLAGVDPHALRWRGAPPLTRSRRSPQRGGLFAIGDAARFVEPVTGEGMAWALSAGQAVAPHVAARLASPGAPETWPGAHRRLLRSRHVRCRVVSRAMRHPCLLGLFMGAMGAAPGVRAGALRALIGAGAPRPEHGP